MEQVHINSWLKTPQKERSPSHSRCNGQMTDDTISKQKFIRRINSQNLRLQKLKSNQTTYGCSFGPILMSATAAAAAHKSDVSCEKRSFLLLYECLLQELYYTMQLRQTAISTKEHR